MNSNYFRNDYEFHTVASGFSQFPAYIRPFLKSSGSNRSPAEPPNSESGF
jgi:hypothetical protein